MLVEARVEISSPNSGAYLCRLHADLEEISLDDLRDVLSSIFVASAIESELIEEKVSYAIEQHGMFTFGKKN